jgi:hypothetical protein
LVLLGFNHRTWPLWGWLYSLSHACSPFGFGYFGDKRLPRSAWAVIHLFYASHCYWDDRHAPLHSDFFFSFFMLRWDLQTFFALAGLEPRTSQSQPLV